MSDVFQYYDGDLPLLVSVPHDGRRIPGDVSERMTQAGREIPDTDWHVAQLYDFVRDLGAKLLVAEYSRYVVDLNRSAQDDVLYPGQLVTGLCPEQTFAGEDIYVGDGVTAEEKERRIAKYWRPYHDHVRVTLTAMRDQHGYALLWDAHSIPSLVPRLFDGELAELNLGTNSGASCAAAIESAVAGILRASDYSSVVNDRFKGGFITRNYGRPDENTHALQLEIAQRAYMDEASRTFDDKSAADLRDTLRQMIRTLLEAAGV